MESFHESVFQLVKSHQDCFLILLKYLNLNNQNSEMIFLAISNVRGFLELSHTSQIRHTHPSRLPCTLLMCTVYRCVAMVIIIRPYKSVSRAPNFGEINQEAPSLAKIEWFPVLYKLTSLNDLANIVIHASYLSLF